MPGARSLRALAGLLVGLVCGCGGSARARYERDLERTSTPARHAVHSERLKELMRGLERLQIERLPQAMDVRTERQLRAGEIGRAARAMAVSARQIGEAAAVFDLEPEEREGFVRLAEELRQHSQQLADEVGRLSPGEQRASAEAIESTCARCHERFRIPGGTRGSD